MWSNPVTCLAVKSPQGKLIEASFYYYNNNSTKEHLFTGLGNIRFIAQFENIMSPN
jgi:hypothetical protein